LFCGNVVAVVGFRRDPRLDNVEGLSEEMLLMSKSIAKGLAFAMVFCFFAAGSRTSPPCFSADGISSIIPCFLALIQETATFVCLLAYGSISEEAFRVCFCSFAFWTFSISSCAFLLLTFFKLSLFSIFF